MARAVVRAVPARTAVAWAVQVELAVTAELAEMGVEPVAEVGTEGLEEQVATGEVRVAWVYVVDAERTVVGVAREEGVWHSTASWHQESVLHP